MITFLFAVALFVPGPNDPVCQAGQSVQVDHCAQGQLPEETTGRAIVPASPVVVSPAAVPAPPATVPTVTELAYTGVPVAPYLVTAGLLIGSGLILRRVATR